MTEQGPQRGLAHQAGCLPALGSVAFASNVVLFHLHEC